jgi:L-malate glycosyltransferase
VKLLFCCQFYAPSIGGVQEVMRQLAEQFVVAGHQVSIATTRLDARTFNTLNGVAIEEFNVSGNGVSGVTGDVQRYQRFVLDGNFDAVMIMAAQQWTFDALWEILPSIVVPKVFIPCGFSGLYEPTYAKYFEQMPEVLKQLDHLIFHSTKYRDIDFSRNCGLENFSVIPVAASSSEFMVDPNPMFRSRVAIPPQSFVFLTVGSFTGLKGHLELVRAFSLLKLLPHEHATLVLNGNQVEPPTRGIEGLYRQFVHLVKVQGLPYILKKMASRLFSRRGSVVKIAQVVNRRQGQKRVLITDLPREDLIQVLFAADLFVFASNVEYSPLVLFEAAAAGTPFLSVDVGNTPEIAKWTGAGVICPSRLDEKGYTRVRETDLASAMAELMRQPDRLKRLGEAGRRNWAETYNWKNVAQQYEQLISKLALKSLEES